MATLGTFTAGQVLTAAELNAIGTWTSYTPTFSDGWAVGNGSLTGAYCQINDVVFVQVSFDAGSTSTFVGNPDFNLPTTGTGDDIFGAQCRIQPSGAGSYIGSAYKDYSSNVRLFVIDTGGSFAQFDEVNGSTPVGWTSAGNFQVELWYRNA